MIFKTVSNWREWAIRFSVFVTLVGIRRTEAQVELFVIEICTCASIQLKWECTDPGQFAIFNNRNLSRLIFTAKYVESAFPCNRAAIVYFCTNAMFKIEISSTVFDRSSQVRYDRDVTRWVCIQNQNRGQICCKIGFKFYNFSSVSIIFEKNIK